MIHSPPTITPELLGGLIERAAQPDFEAFEAQLRSSGYCARPVRLRGTIETCDAHGRKRVWSTDTEPDGVLRKACGNRREAVCAPCAERYRQDAYHLIMAGLRGGKGVPESVVEHFAELLRDLVARGRAAGVIVVAATQKPAADVVPSSLRDLFGFRLALRCTTRDASDTILGHGWASNGFNAATIAPDQRGIGFLLADDGLPVRMRAFYLDDEAVDALAERAAALREATSW